MQFYLLPTHLINFYYAQNACYCKFGRTNYENPSVPCDHMILYPCDHMILYSVITWSYTPVITAVVLIIQLKNGRLIWKFICLFSLRVFVFSPSMHSRTFLTACVHCHMLVAVKLVTITHACIYIHVTCEFSLCWAKCSNYPRSVRVLFLHNWQQSFGVR